MVVNTTIFSVLNAIIALIIALITSVVGLYQVRRITRERLDETIEDYAKINAAKDIRLEELTKQSDKQATQISDTNYRLGTVESHNRWLLEKNMLNEQYCQALTGLLRRNNIPVPPAPRIEEPA